MKPALNFRFVIRGGLFGILVVIAAALGSWSWFVNSQLDPAPTGPIPPPPTILVPQGPMPAGRVGLQEWAQYQGEDYQMVGSGFILRLGDGRLVGVTTAHSLSPGDAGHRLQRVGLSVAGQTGFVVEFDTLHGLPGRPRWGANMTVDYVLLRARGLVAPEFVLRLDPRGAPQPGERVWLFSGQGKSDGRREIYEGTAQSVSDQAVWVSMDEVFHPSGMSGSPLVSQHTGQAVGMAIAANTRDGRLLIGAHPIGSLVRLAEAAQDFPTLAEFTR